MMRLIIHFTRTRLPLFTLVLFAFLASLSTRPAAATTPAPSAFVNFITRQGDKLMDGDKEFRFFGANMPGMIMPYDFTLYLPERLTLPTPWEQENAFKTLAQMNQGAVRLWNLPMRGPKEGPEMDWKYVQAPGKFNEESFKTIDNMFALANKHGVRVIFDFTADAGDYMGGIGTYAAWRGKQRKEFFTDPQLREDFKATLRYVLTRRNTVTGQLYKDDKAVLAWQFGNEMDVIRPPREWHAEMAAYIKSLDPNHLVMYGERKIHADPDPNIDIITMHYYGGDWAKTTRDAMKTTRGKRPYIVGEFGPYIAKPADVEPVLKNHHALLDTVIEEGAAGAMLWSMYFHKEAGGYYWHQIMTYPSVWSFHWPGSPSGAFHHERDIVRAMRDAAFRIQGQQPTPLPAPEPAQMLPIAGDAPMLSWRGSVGADGYDIQRAAKPEGPWTTIAENVSDADVAYRPLYSDTRVKPGDEVCYRVIARNESGASAPSNAIGPFTVGQVCLVDEFKDLKQVAGKSAGLTFNNDYNALYMEYLYRVRGDSGAWIGYKLPGDVQAFKLVAFFSDKPQDPVFTVSKDGREFKEASVKRIERPLRSPESGPASKQRRIMVEYQGQAGGGARFLNIQWRGPAEFDRLEVYYQ